MITTIITLFLLSCASSLRVGKSMKIAGVDCNNKDQSVTSAPFSITFSAESDVIKSIHTDFTVLIPCNRFNDFRFQIELEGKAININVNGQDSLYNAAMSMTEPMNMQALGLWLKEFKQNPDVFVSSNVEIKGDLASIRLIYVPIMAIQVLEQHKQNFDFNTFNYVIQQDDTAVEYEIEIHDTANKITNDQIKLLMAQHLNKFSSNDPNEEIVMKGKDGQEIRMMISKHIVQVVNNTEQS